MPLTPLSPPLHRQHTKMSPPQFRQLMSLKFLPFLLMGLFTHMVLSQSVVEYLPGFPGKLPFTLETGYIGVGESEELQLFYYFIESERSPENDPLLLWLIGGPGCSGVSTLFYEFGPLHFDYTNSDGIIPALVLNPHSWTKVANIIFLDQLAGSGFSYGKTAGAYEYSDTLSAKSNYEFLQKWLINHPKYPENPLYIAGGSYGGITVPLAVNEVYNGIEAGKKPLLNMKGYLLGNPITDRFGDTNGRVAYAHQMGLLSDELYLSAKENCNGNYQNVDPDNDLCNHDLERVNQCLEKISTSHILEPWCDILLIEKQGRLLHHMPSHEGSAARFLQSVPLHAGSWCRVIFLFFFPQAISFLQAEVSYVFFPPRLETLFVVPKQPMNMLYSYKWANIKLVQKALQVREGTVIDWLRCNSTIRASYTYDVNSTVDYHKRFTEKDCRALIYSGDHDMGVPHSATDEWIKSLKLHIQSEWRPWFVENQIAGYTTAYFHDNYELTFATVKGAGHTPPEYKPLECFPLFERWLSGRPL